MDTAVCYARLRGIAIMDQSTNDVEDKRVITLAAEIAETSDKNVPGLLLELQGER